MALRVWDSVSKAFGVVFVFWMGSEARCLAGPIMVRVEAPTLLPEFSRVHRRR